MPKDTTYITLKQAATIINTDIDSILSSALEDGIHLYWPLNQSVEAEYVGLEGSDDASNPEFLNILLTEFREFKFVPLTKASLSSIMNKGSADAVHEPLDHPDETGYYWRAVQDKTNSTFILKGLDNVFLLRSDLEAPEQLTQDIDPENNETTTASTPVDEANSISTKHTGTSTRWTSEEIDKLKKYRDTHSAKETAYKFGITRQRVDWLLKNERPIPTSNNPFGIVKAS